MMLLFCFTFVPLLIYYLNFKYGFSMHLEPRAGPAARGA